MIDRNNNQFLKSVYYQSDVFFNFGEVEDGTYQANIQTDRCS